MQIEIEGIGQQLGTLADWKKNNNIFTTKINDENEINNYACWNDIACPHEFMDDYGNDAIGLGKTEKEAIIEFCGKEKIPLPFWW